METNRYGYQIFFELEDAPNYLSLTLDLPESIKDITLNGAPVPIPLEGMEYRTIPGIPATLLKEGENVLIAKTYVPGKKKRRKKSQIVMPSKVYMATDGKFALQGLLAEDLVLQTGPILGSASQTSVTVACRVNLPAEVQLILGDQTLIAKKGLMHSFKVEGLSPNTDYSYTLQGRPDATSAWATLSESYSVKTFPLGGDLEFIAMGDCRSNPEGWGAIAAAVTKHKPMFCAFSGDMVTIGQHDVLWDKELFSPAKEFFATIPYYAIIGNHEGGAPLFTRVFPTPSGTPTWEQRVGSAHIISIDGEEDWSAESEKTKWLEGVLAASDAKFIFLFSHFPAWTSGQHGRLIDGQPKEQPIRDGQEVIVPLMSKYNATAMIAGHDHTYERSEVPGNISVIVSGGAGAPLRDKVEGCEIQNPYSVAFASEYHYCLFSIKGDQCTITAYAPAGDILDTHVWNAREAK
ncbi:purple acid phosphatase family protein [Pontiella sulfatireligans]|uniref:purple acid phosphatase family protein n=1 Tax=Pontiella sulfatireligans TaxID=2750658 RepID=UPI001443D6A7|nr:metallophosphoesterase family protein [Pontiella sulfatireligans]